MTNNDKEIYQDLTKILDRIDELEKAPAPKETISYVEFMKRRGVDIDAIIAATN